MAAPLGVMPALELPFSASVWNENGVRSFEIEVILVWGWEPAKPATLIKMI